MPAKRWISALAAVSALALVVAACDDDGDSSSDTTEDTTVSDSTGDVDSDPTGDATGDQNLVETAVAAGDFTTLATALEAAGLVDTLSTGGPYTVFAPTDAAFEALPPGTLDELLADPEALREVLLYHVVEGEVPASEVVTLSSATTLNGADVTITVDGETVKVNDATVTQTDVTASNGVIHVIDRVLIPPTS
jgi:uncharacterized surface protein with fasciclin (FAS1) repeats